MDERHGRRGQQELPALESGPRTRHTHGGPHGGAQVGFPRFAAEFPAADFERPLAAKILRLFVREDFARERIRLDDPQFCQTITSF
jgi:hypothetical protein